MAGDTSVSVNLRRETYARLTTYKDDTKCKDYSTAIENLLQVVLRPTSARVTRKKDSKLFLAICYLYRFGLIALGLYLLYQLAFFLYFPLFQVTQHPGDGKRVLFYGDPQIEGFARIKRQGIFGKSFYLLQPPRHLRSQR